MEMKQLRSYIAVIRYGSFTKAAEKTFTSQPTISAHVKALEEELGVQLLARDTKNLTVTDKGSERAVRINHHGRTDDLTLRFRPNESLLLHVTESGVEQIDLAYTAPHLPSE